MTTTSKITETAQEAYDRAVAATTVRLPDTVEIDHWDHHDSTVASIVPVDGLRDLTADEIAAANAWAADVIRLADHEMVSSRSPRPVTPAPGVTYVDEIDVCHLPL